MKLFIRSLLFVYVSSFMALSASASCGLAGCPVNLGDGEKSNHLIDQAFRYVTFDINHHDGNYLQFEPRYEYRGFKKIILGGFASIVSLDDGHNSDSGLGNPVVFGQVEVWTQSGQSLSLGTQVELALGEDDKGLAAEHTELVPYLTFANSNNPMHWMASVGYRAALDSDDGHGHGGGLHTELFVNPHDDKEFLYRFHALLSGLHDKVSPEVFLDGQHALDGDDDGTGFLSAGVGLQCGVSSQFSLTPKVELPVTSPRRFETKFSLHASLTF